MRRLWIVFILAIVLVSVVAGCADQDEPPTPTAASPTAQPAETATPAQPTPTPLAEPLFLLARVESLEMLSTDGEPNSNAVRLRGVLSNSCSRLDDVVSELKGSVFTIAVLEVQDLPQSGQECITEEVPFDTTVELVDIPPGSYSVRAHGLQGSFTVVEAATPTQEPASTTPVTGPLSGVVWHDLCQGTAGTQDELPPGCAANAQGAAQADGEFSDEPGISGVRVGLAAGDCTAPATESSVSDADGRFAFDDLPAGPYCISIDMQDRQNAQILNDGAWTSPSGQAEQLILIEDEGGVNDAGFGWDYEFLPLAPFDPETCERSFAYLEDVNMPDDTELAPNQAFTKRWRLQNNGTCPWTDDYRIVFVGGDQMSAPDSLPLPWLIAPGQSVEIAIEMIAPEAAGTYRGNWQIADPNGEPFGIDGIVEDAFYLRIIVNEDAPSQAPSSGSTGTIGGVVWDDSCLNSDPDAGCVEYPEGSGIYIADGTFGSQEDGLAEITISLASQSCPGDGSLPPAARVLATAVTSADGQYRFPNLETGMYCIFMDALSAENVNLLIPGNWTWPATGVGRYTFFLDPGEQALDLDFGWDFAD